MHRNIILESFYVHFHHRFNVLYSWVSGNRDIGIIGCCTYTNTHGIYASMNPAAIPSYMHILAYGTLVRPSVQGSGMMYHMLDLHYDSENISPRWSTQESAKFIYPIIRHGRPCPSATCSSFQSILARNYSACSSNGHYYEHCSHQHN